MTKTQTVSRRAWALPARRAAGTVCARRASDACSSYAMIAPAIIFLLLFTVYPVMNLVQLSFFKGNANNPFKEFVGLDNYHDLFFVRDDFLNALKNTAVYTVAVVVLLIALSVLFALWMFSDRRINRFAQTAFFTPHLVAAISCAFIWSWLYSPETYGLFNYVLRFFGIPPFKWLNDANSALICVIIMNVWKSVGYYAIIVLSALKAIPVEIYEAAKLDNASRVKVFFKLTLPLLSPQLFFLLIIITTGSFKVFDSIRIMTDGGPGQSTQVMSMFIYTNSFMRNNSLGIGATSGTVLMLILMAATMVNFRGIENKVHYQ